MPKSSVNLVVCGTIGLDTITTPFGSVTNALGGSASYAAIAASYFFKPGIISIAGTDLPAKHRALLEAKHVDLTGLETTGKNFRWSGKYEFDLAEATTLATELNSLSGFKPTIPASYRSARVLLLANIDPTSQQSVARQLPDAFVILDTMNFWIDQKRAELLEAIGLTDVLVINEAEARQLTSELNLVKAAKQLLKLGLTFVIIKQGEHGALLVSDHGWFSAPGYPLEVIKDPTGAGDSFAGALAGYLAKRSVFDESTLRKAVIYGSALASFCVEQFSVDGTAKLTPSNIRERYHVFKKLQSF